jgi:hypothetical protein
MSRHS